MLCFFFTVICLPAVFSTSTFKHPVHTTFIPAAASTVHHSSVLLWTAVLPSSPSSSASSYSSSCTIQWLRNSSSPHCFIPIVTRNQSVWHLEFFTRHLHTHNHFQPNGCTSTPIQHLTASPHHTSAPWVWWRST